MVPPSRCFSHRPVGFFERDVWGASYMMSSSQWLKYSRDPEMCETKEEPTEIRKFGFRESYRRTMCWWTFHGAFEKLTMTTMNGLSKSPSWITSVRWIMRWLTKAKCFCTVRTKPGNRWPKITGSLDMGETVTVCFVKIALRVVPASLPSGARNGVVSLETVRIRKS